MRHPHYARAMTAVWVVQFMALSSCYLMLVLPRILNQQAIDVSWQGWIMATFNFAFLIGSLVCGRAVERRGYRLPALLGCSAIIAGCLLYSAGRYGVPWYFAARWLHGFGVGIVLLAWQNRVVVIAQPEQRGRALGMTNLLGFVALAISPLIAEGMQRVGENNVVFFTAAALCVPVLPLAMRLPALPVVHQASLAEGVDRFSIPECAVLILILAHGAAISSTQLLLPLITGGKQSWSFSGFFLAYGMTCVWVRLWLEPYLHRRVHPLAMVASVCLMPAAAVLLVFAHMTVAFAGIGVLFGLAHGLYFPCTVQIITRAAAPHQIVSRIAKVSAMGVVGLMLGECGAGLLARYAGVRTTLGIVGVSLAMLQILTLLPISRGTRATGHSTRTHERV